MRDISPSTTIIDLFTHDLHLGSRGTVRAGERRMANGDGDADWRLAMFHAETDDDVHADHWERHPRADEVVCCLRGAIRLHLRATRPDAPDDVVVLLPGQAATVPRDRWHRLEVDEPADLLAVTIRRGTQHEKRTAADRSAPPPRVAGGERRRPRLRLVSRPPTRDHGEHPSTWDLIG
jgi:mannose-6-phosphate isomerase-like protein (cupin superfamily)